jgi:hypothetical protein
MEENVTITPLVCSYCHQPVLSSYYFCPNCGTKLNLAPLSTSVESQALLYLFSAILPLICFIFVTRWQGLRYYRSRDEKTKLIGTIAIVILILSTVITIWLAYAWTQSAIQSSINSINADFGA